MQPSFSSYIHTVKASVLGIDKSHVPDQIKDPVSAAKLKQKHPQGKQKLFRNLNGKGKKTKIKPIIIVVDIISLYQREIAEEWTRLG